MKIIPEMKNQIIAILTFFWDSFGRASRDATVDGGWDGTGFGTGIVAGEGRGDGAMGCAIGGCTVWPVRGWPWGGCGGCI